MIWRVRNERGENMKNGTGNLPLVQQVLIEEVLKAKGEVSLTNFSHKGFIKTIQDSWRQLHSEV